MEHLKISVLVVVATGALMALAGAATASATVLCSTTADPCQAGQKWPAKTILDFSLTSGTSLEMKETGEPEGSGEVLKTCKSSRFKSEISSSGSSTATVTGPVTELTWGACTFPTSTVLKGKLELHKIAGTSNGTVTADGETRWTTNTFFFGSCIYTVASEKSMGDLTEGNPALFHINTVAQKTTGSEFTCPATAVWTATYTLTSPAGTTLSVSSS